MDVAALDGMPKAEFVAGRSRADLVPVLEAALAEARPAEIQRALKDVVLIAQDRFQKVTRTAEGVG